MIKSIKDCEKLADKCCAECLISKHSSEYINVVRYIALFSGFSIEHIGFDVNNIPYLKEVKND